MQWSPPDPALGRDGIWLRPFRADDAAAVADACADPDIVRFTFMQADLSVTDALAWIDRGNEWWEHGHPRFAIVADDDRLLGQIGLAVDEHHRSAEAYYWLRPDARGRGTAAIAVSLIADWAFENGVERIMLLIHPENDASNRLAERCGFTREGVLRAYEPFKGGRPDLVSWSLLPDDPRPWCP